MAEGFNQEAGLAEAIAKAMASEMDKLAAAVETSVERGMSRAYVTQGKSHMPSRLSNPEVPLSAPKPSDVPDIPVKYDYGSGFSGMTRALAATRLPKVTAKYQARAAQAADDARSKGEDPYQASQMVITRGNITLGALHGHSTGQGILSGIANMGFPLAGELAPYAEAAAGAFEVAKDIPKEAVDQRAANMRYQSIYGGSNLSGLGQRFQGEVFDLRHMFDMGSKNASEAFYGVSQLGWQGDQRSNALNVISEMYNKVGLSVKDSLAMVQAAAESGNKSLAGLADSISSVTKVSGSYGLNANQVRQNYTQNLQTVGQAFGGQSSQFALSAAVTNATSSFGLAGQGINIGQAIASDTIISSVAGQTGLGYDGVVNALGTNQGFTSGRATTVAQSVDSTIDRFIGPVLPRIIATITKNLGPYDPKSTAWAALSQDGGSGWAQQNAVSIVTSSSSQADLNTLTQGLRSVIPSITSPEQAALYAVMRALSIITKGQMGYSLAGSIAKESNSIKNQGVSPDTLDKNARLFVSQVTNGGTSVPTLNAAEQASVKKFLGAYGVTNVDFTPTNTTPANSGLDSGGPTPSPAVPAQLSKSQSSAIHDALTGNKDQQSTSTVVQALSKNYANAKFVVQTSQGPREVGLTDLQQNYSDQIANGQARFADGSSISDSIPYLPTSASAKSATQAPMGKTSAIKSLGTITLDATPTLKTLITASGSSNGSVDYSNTSNLPQTGVPTAGNNPGASASNP